MAEVTRQRKGLAGGKAFSGQAPMGLQTSSHAKLRLHLPSLIHVLEGAHPGLACRVGTCEPLRLLQRREGRMSHPQCQKTGSLERGGGGGW